MDNMFGGLPTIVPQLFRCRRVLRTFAMEMIWILLYIFNLVEGSSHENYCLIPMVCNDTPAWVKIGLNGTSVCQESLESGVREHYSHDLGNMKETLQSIQQQTMELGDRLQKAASFSTVPAIGARNFASPKLSATTSTASKSASTSTLAPTTSSTQQTTATIDETTIGYDGIFYHGAFYNHVILKDVNFARAEEECTNLGGSPANIYSDEHFQNIVNYIEAKGSETTYFWLGLRYKSNHLEFFNGTAVPATFPAIWDSSKFPQRNKPQYDKVFLSVTPGKSAGTMNTLAEYGTKGVLCEVR